MWIALATPLVMMIGAVGMARLEPAVLHPVTPTSDDPLQHPINAEV
ncbi:hypothetical protein [Actinokineospora pegani]|nr:hypothetical protein [Actinokineospora pegani]